MTITVNEKTRDLFPPSIRRRARLKIGDRLEIQVNGGIVSFIPKLPTADDEYTSGQRRTIDARLAKADEDIRDGRTYGPFHNVGEMIASMKSELRKRKASTKNSKSRR